MLLWQRRTKWNDSAYAVVNTRARKKNIVSQIPKVRAPLSSVTNIIDIWKGFFTNDVVDLIVNHTNKEIDRVRNNYIRATYARQTNENEAYAVIGILLLSGVQKSNKLNITVFFTPMELPLNFLD